MAENVFEELKRYVGFGPDDEAALRGLHEVARPHFRPIADVFYRRILEHEDARTALEGGERQVGRLKGTLVAWMDRLLSGPWDDAYFELRCRIGRVHVRIALPQHYMFGAMNVLRRELGAVVDQAHAQSPKRLGATRSALGKILDLELAIMLHTYREDLLEQRARAARLSTFGQLVGSIGHELRNPLGVIETSLFILEGRVSGDERAEKHVGRIREQVRIANDIVTSLLDMIRDRPLAKERLRVAEVVRQAVQGVPRGEVEVAVDCPESLEVEADATQLRQVFVNLVTNAVQASGPQGRVKVSAALRGARLEARVEDTGPGVAPEVRGRIFEPLVTTKAKGIGLGLALVKRIAERHGGAIRYEPIPEGGARFILTLPGAS